MTDRREQQHLTGVPVTGGVVLGPLHRLGPAQRTGAPVCSLEEAIARAAADLEDLIAEQDTLAGEILEFQLALLEDDDLLTPIQKEVLGGVPPDMAWMSALDREIREYRADGDAVLSARADDLRDLRDRVLDVLHDQTGGSAVIPQGAILLSDDLTPSIFLGLDWSRLAGAAVRGGSATSHVSILARARGIPLMVGLDRSDVEIAEDTVAVLDLGLGRLTLNPTEATLAEARSAMEKGRRQASEFARILNRPARTADGQAIQVMVNIDAPAILDGIAPECCDGIGLTRTEFLFQDGAPDEDSQLAFYRRLIVWAKGRPVTVRTLDAGGDKPLPGITEDGEANPFLGIRGVRLSLRQPDLFRVQLRALVRAAALGDIKVMVPMVTVPRELDEVRRLMREAVEELTRAGIACTLPEIGMMVEVPAAALTADMFEADFYSIGSNDLIQYATASARDNAAVAALADPANPAVLHMIRATVAAGTARGVPVSLCGDMASSPEHAAALLDAGLRCFSCAPAQVAAVKTAIMAHSLGLAG